MKRTTAILFAVLMTFGAGSAWALNLLAAHERPVPAALNTAALIGPEQLAALSGDFAPALADIHWIQAISAAGESVEAPNGPGRLYQLLQRVVHLDPRFEPAYQYGALLLSIRAARPDLSDQLLQRAQRQFPDNWEYPFYLGFNRFYYDTDFLTAADFFEQAAERPGAPPYLAALSHRFRDQQHNVGEAKELLRRILRVSDDDTVKARLKARLAELERLR